MQIFDIVRQQLNSGLDNQRQAAILLHAVEESIKEQDQELVPVAYFAVLMTMIETASQQEIVSSACYLLSIVFSHVPTPVLNQKFTTITGLLDDSILETFMDDAPIVKSVLACLEHLLIVQQQWKHDQRKVFTRILSISLDDRPKVRKRAAEAVKRIIASPPPPSLSHPGTITTIDFSIHILQSYLDDNSGHKFQKDRHSKVLDVLVFLKLMISVFAKQSRNEKLALKLDSLARILLALPIKSSGSGDSVLTHWVFEVLDSLMADKLDDSLAFSVVAMIVQALLEMRPHENDSVLTPSWLSLMTNGFDRIGESICALDSSTEEQDQVVAEFYVQYPSVLTNFFERIFSTFFTSASKLKPSIIEGATKTLIGLIENGISNAMVTQALSDYESSHLFKILNLLENAMENINFRDNWGNLLKVVGSLFRRLGMDCPQFTEKLLRLIMNFRDDKSYGAAFPYKDELEECLHSAFQSLGMENFCTIIPLNIEVEDESAESIRRPYLLATFGAALNTPLTLSSWTPWKILGAHSLSYYTSTFLPLANRLLTKSGKLWEENRQLESKLFETLGLQIWDLFPLLCLNLPNDVPKAFGKIAPQLGKILTTTPADLYPNLPSQADLRPVVCLGLEHLVESFSLFANLTPEEEDDADKLKWKEAGSKIGTEAISKMKTYVNRFLSALCNLYIAVDLSILKEGKAKGQALQVLNERAIQYYEKPIRKFLTIADQTNITEYFMTMASSVQGKPFSSCTDVEKLGVYTTFDLMLIFLPHLGEDFETEKSPLKTVYNLLFAKLKETDATMQKKTYKMLVNLFNYLPLANIDQQLLVNQLLEDELVSHITSGASKLRVKLIQLIVEQSDDKNLLLSFIPQALPEVMLATKEANEKSRDAAYDCIIAMAKKMKSGSEAMSLDESLADSSSEISIKEFFVMVTAGLGGESAHMQSASVASLGRLLFEFYEELEPEMIQELIKTVLITMSFKNREVAKAALGFIKVAIVCLPLDILEFDLNSIVKTILTHSRDHKSHFKSKVRHIFERLIRKFGFERIDSLFPEEDKKLILNIKKRRESSKRRANLKREEEREESNSKPKPAKFEEAFHDSGSELGSDDEEGYIPEQFRNETLTKKSSKNPLTIIREDEEVVDFLDRNVVSQIAHSSSKTSSRSKSSKTEFPTTNDGMLVFDQEDSDQEMVQPEVSEDYYKKSLASEVSFTRGADGKVKFLKRKRQEDDQAQEDDKEIGKRWHSAKDKHTKPENYSKMLGAQYKSKKAKGDVKRPGMADPHAFIPLSGKIVGNMNKTTKLDGTLKNILKAATKGGSVKVKSKSGGKGISKQNKKHRK